MDADLILTNGVVYTVDAAVASVAVARRVYDQVVQHFPGYQRP